jgi:hypothetical protein
VGRVSERGRRRSEKSLLKGVRRHSEREVGGYGYRLTGCRSWPDKSQCVENLDLTGKKSIDAESKTIKQPPEGP